MEAKFMICGCDSKDNILLKIKNSGGWPNGYKFLNRFHGVSPFSCEFSNDYIHGPWCTTICCSDDYYWFIISEEKKNAIRNSFIEDFKTRIMDLN